MCTWYKTHLKHMWKVWLCMYNKRSDDFALGEWLNIWHHQYSMCVFLGKCVGGWGDSYAPKATKKKMDTNALISDARHSNLIPKSCASVSVCYKHFALCYLSHID